MWQDEDSNGITEDGSWITYERLRVDWENTKKRVSHCREWHWWGKEFM